MPRRVSDQICAMVDCDRPRHAKGMCQKHYLRDWALRNREKAKGYARTSYLANREERLEYQRRYREENREQYLATNRDWHLRTKFGINLEEYERCVRDQDGCCAICDEPQTGDRKLAVDHDHETGEVRALLCTRCNVAIGLLRDDPVLAERVAGYLASFGRLYADGVGS